MPRAAVILNPVKVTTALRPALTTAMAARGWAEALWLETTEEDPGHSMTRQALDAGVDRVIVAGGDGTVRLVAGELAGSGVPLGLIPSGTGNLLARNLQIPLAEGDAVELALGDERLPMDLIKVTVDDREPEWSAVMAGIGIDAMIMDNTDPELKKKIGSAAYFVAGAQQLGRLPVHLRIQVDHERPFSRYAVLCLVGNVGKLTGGLELLPEADPTDGQFDVLIASPRRKRDLLRVVIRLLLRHRRPDKAMDRLTGRRIVVVVREGDEFQVDGDSAGSCRRLVAELVPAAVEVVAPVPNPATANRAEPPRHADLRAEDSGARDDTESGPGHDLGDASQSEGPGESADASPTEGPDESGDESRDEGTADPEPTPAAR